MATWEETFSSWAKGPGKTEEARCENAIRAIKNAIGQSSKLNHRSIDIFVQGSYRNRVNVRKDSDVDVGVLCHDTVFSYYPPGTDRSTFSNDPATYHYPQFKNEVEEALVAHFGRGAVHRGNKSFDISQNSYRVDADVAPFFEYRSYAAGGAFHQGVKLIPDNGGEVINWPQQHYDNGVSKNTTTNRRFKRLVRIVKHLSVYMGEQGKIVGKNTPGFLIECLVYNVPDERFGHTTYTADVRAVLAHVLNNTLTAEKCGDWTEVSVLKDLFYQHQKWTVASAHAFANSAWNFLGLE